ncbi:MAG: NYN domain-containing protein [Propionibacteriaceae bacterium]|nr:NYN domain-containing protein [Propionibacteriaceae bacterium]
MRYPPDWPNSSAGERPREKGVDVELAVDFVAMAVQNDYDVGIMMSLDTDLVPALEFVDSLRSRSSGSPRAEVAAWSVTGHRKSRLSVPGKKIFCHWLTEQDYPAVADPTSYV